MQSIVALLLVQQLENIRDAHGKTVVGKGRMCLVLLAQLLLGRQHVLNVVDCQRRDNHVEVSQMTVLLIPEFRRKHLHKFLPQQKHNTFKRKWKGERTKCTSKYSVPSAKFLDRVDRCSSRTLNKTERKTSECVWGGEGEGKREREDEETK